MVGSPIKTERPRTRSRSRGRSQSQPRPLAKKHSFRDELQLVSVRYEKTAQGDLPIPILTRTSSRTLRPSSSRPASSHRPASASRPNSSSASSFSYNPVVVVPPLPTPAPPTEEHPALRAGPVLPQKPVQQDRKRDSGHATSSNSSSTPTIDEEDDGETDSGKDYLSTSGTSRAVSPAMMSIKENSIAESIAEEERSSMESAPSEATSIGQMLDSDKGSIKTFLPDAADPQMQSAEALERVQSVSSEPQPMDATMRPLTPERTPTRSPSRSRMSKNMNFRATRSSWLHQDGLVSESEGAEEQGGRWAIGQALPMQAPLMRGSAPSPEATAPAASTSTSTDGGQPLAAQLAGAPSTTARHPASAVTSLFKRVLFSSKFKSHSKRNAERDSTDFAPLAVSIPSASLLDDGFMTNLTFSNRGSLMFGGQNALKLDRLLMDNHLDTQPRAVGHDAESNPADGSRAPPPPSTSSISAVLKRFSSSIERPSSIATDATPDTGYITPDGAPQQFSSSAPDVQVLTAEVELESQKVRSLYAIGGASGQDAATKSPIGERQAPLIEEPSAEDSDNDSLTQIKSTPRRVGSSLLNPDSTRNDSRQASGYEDWDDLEGATVDRYGFISVPRPSSSRIESSEQTRSVHYSPRRRNVLQKGSLSSASAIGRSFPSRKMSARSLNTYHSGMSATSLRSSRSVMRHASNMLPQNRDRRAADEASEMMTTSPGLHDIADEVRAEKISEALKRKEWERSEKWRKMARNVRKGAQGEGTEFEFDVKNPKLIERTWKGIPDRWRAAAWWSFLAASAKQRPGMPSEEEVIKIFHELQERSSPDDVQIDLDVPRTVNLHIMFRKRYEGGQRLLFRVLHALSIYFPETGYVQGMASLGATLLCYFDEEKSFVMLVRMWQLRGLERLYRHGFEGLMTGLCEFETFWLHKDVAKKLKELGIEATAYGTRWYLTLFNLSLPFPAQLRVWDVFLLLGDGGVPFNDTRPQSRRSMTVTMGPPTGLGVLHATSAAIVQGLREVLLDSDFENAMKALTSFVPIKDEDILMKVTKAEWKSRKSRRKA